MVQTSTLSLETKQLVPSSGPTTVDMAIETKQKKKKREVSIDKILKM